MSGANPNEPTRRPAPQPYRSHRPSPAATIAVIAAAVGFFCSLETLNRSVVDGVETCSYFNLGALIFGVLAGAAGIAALVVAARPPRQPVVEVSMGAVAVAIAVVHVLRAFGVIGGPC